MKKIFPYLVLISALILAGAAAFFSVTGLAKLFSGAAVEVIIMASALELSKIIAASFLHKYWSKSNRGLRYYLTSGVVVLSIITSIGIYGFLSNAYSVTSGKLSQQDSQVEVLEEKKSLFEEEKNRHQEDIKNKNQRIENLSGIRKQQETRLDSLYQRKWYSSAKQTEQNITDLNNQINKLNTEIEELTDEIKIVNDSISSISIKIIEVKNSDVAGEVGPLKYISNITRVSMDKVVNFLILLFVFVFDPLAISMVIASNTAFNKIENKSTYVKDVIEDFEKIEEKLSFENEDDEQIENKDTSFESIEDNIDADIKSTEDEIDINVKPIEDSIDADIKSTEDEIDIEAKPIEGSINADVKSTEDDFNISSSEDEKEDEENKEESLIELPPIQQYPVYNQRLDEASTSISKTKRNSTYLILLDLMYEGDKSKGDELPSFMDFLSKVKSLHQDLEEKDIRDFLTACNMLKIIHLKEGEPRIFLKDYAQAKSIIDLI